MSAKTGIEWTDATWNPVTGCTEVSPGCDHCYAKNFAERFRGTPGHYFEHGFDVQLRPDKLDLPLRWRKPKRIFVNSMSDLFHDAVPDEYIVRVFAVMKKASQHTFQVLTKRHARMRALLSSEDFRESVFAWSGVGQHQPSGRLEHYRTWPLSNVWLGVSTENQQWAGIRIPALLDTPAAVRFISAEPLLGAIDFRRVPRFNRIGLDLSNWWVIVGGESGPGARPMHPDWARALRDQCQAAGVPFLFKQWGEWAPIDPDAVTGKPTVFFGRDGEGTHYSHRHRDGVATLARVGKKAAGRQLDGQTWDQPPVSKSTGATSTANS